MSVLSSLSVRPLAALVHYAPANVNGTNSNISNNNRCSPYKLYGSRSYSSSFFGFSFVNKLISPASSLKFQPSRFQPSASASAGSVAEQSIYDFTVKDIDGKDISLSKYKGKVLLIVNVASQCGLTTSNYTELSQLYDKFKGESFEILAFPCNQFGGQEPGSNQQIKQFACSRFKAEYPIFDKVDVNGENAAPVYKFLKTAKSSSLLGVILGDNIKWNFEKFLVDKNGQVVKRYDPTTSPLKIESDVRTLLQS